MIKTMTEEIKVMNLKDMYEKYNEVADMQVLNRCLVISKLSEYGFTFVSKNKAQFTKGAEPFLIAFIEEGQGKFKATLETQVENRPFKFDLGFVTNLTTVEKIISYIKPENTKTFTNEELNENFAKVIESLVTLYDAIQFKTGFKTAEFTFKHSELKDSYKVVIRTSEFDKAFIIPKAYLEAPTNVFNNLANILNDVVDANSILNITRNKFREGDVESLVDFSLSYDGYKFDSVVTINDEVVAHKLYRYYYHHNHGKLQHIFKVLVKQLQQKHLLNNKI